MSCDRAKMTTNLEIKPVQRTIQKNIPYTNTLIICTEISNHFLFCIDALSFFIGKYLNISQNVFDELGSLQLSE